MENNEKIHNPGCEKLLLVPKINSTTPGEMIAFDSPPANNSVGKFISTLRTFMTEQEFKIDLLRHKSDCYKYLLESKEVTLTEEGKQHKGLIDRL